MGINRRVSLLAFAAFSTIAASSAVQSNHLCDGFAPENDLKIPVTKSNKGISEEQFNAILDKVITVYNPIFAEKGATFDLQRSWSDGTVNAYALQNGKTWTIKMFGGLARHETVTQDGFLMVACHEIGHHLGGAPKKGWISAWASNEGQSDYYATLKCFRIMAEANMLPEQDTTQQVPAFVTEHCMKHEAPADQQLCQRAAMAGLSVSSLLHVLGNGSGRVSFETPDLRVVSTTDHNHPKAQCRLDTYFAGSLCTVSHKDALDDKNSFVGTCNKAQGFPLIQSRPSCWFKEPAFTPPAPPAPPAPTQTDDDWDWLS